MLILSSETSQPLLYKIMIGSVLPRPIAWVSSINREGKTNLAPFSFFNAVGSNPPMICFSPGYGEMEETAIGPRVKPKDTLKNITEVGEFVVNIVSRPLAEKMNQTSADYPAGLSEFDAAGVTAAPSHLVAAPRVAESLINMECKLFQIVRLGDKIGSGSLIIGEVVCFHLDDRVYKDGQIDPDVLQPIGRMAGALYSTVCDRFEMRRPPKP
ncbi:MAG TPA: flavin reductase family protein [Chroococcales cyanobacterium]